MSLDTVGFPRQNFPFSSVYKTSFLPLFLHKDNFHLGISEVSVRNI